MVGGATSALPPPPSPPGQGRGEVSPRESVVLGRESREGVLVRALEGSLFRLSLAPRSRAIGAGFASQPPWVVPRASHAVLTCCKIVLGCNRLLTQ